MVGVLLLCLIPTVLGVCYLEDKYLQEKKHKKQKTHQIFSAIPPQAKFKHSPDKPTKYSRRFPIINDFIINGKKYNTSDLNSGYVEGLGLRQFGINCDSIIFYEKPQDTEDLIGEFIVLNPDYELSKLDPFGKVNMSGECPIIRRCIGEISSEGTNPEEVASEFTNAFKEFIKNFSKRTKIYKGYSDQLEEIVKKTLVAHQNVKNFVVTVIHSGSAFNMEPYFEIFPRENVIGVVRYSHEC